MSREKLEKISAEIHDRLTLRMPLQGPHIGEPRNGGTVVSIAPLGQRDALIPWFNKFGSFTKDYVPNIASSKNDFSKKTGLWIRIYPHESVHLLNISKAQHVELATAWATILNKIVAAIENHKPISLAPIAEQCHERLDILTFVDGPHPPGSQHNSSLTEYVLRLLPLMLRQLRAKYHWILIDLPEFWYPQVQSIVEISTHWVFPYQVVDEKMMDKIFEIKSFFMSLRKSGAPFDCGGIIPVFTGREPGTYVQDFENLESIFGPRLWPFLPDSDGLSQEALDAYYQATFLRFCELIGGKKYGAKKIEIFNKVYTLLKKSKGYVEKSLLKQWEDRDLYTQLIQLLSQRTTLSDEQEARIKSISYSTMLAIMQKIYDSMYKISIDYILAALEIEDVSVRKVNLSAVVETSDPSVQTMAKLIGIKAKNAGHYLFKIWLTRHLTLEFCKKKMGIAAT